jgi:hypothetical protein
LRTVHTETEINAPSERVWQEITDLASYREWNPFVTEAEGEVKVGEKLRMSYTTPGGKNWRRYANKRTNVRHSKVTTIIPGKEWSHGGSIPLLLSVTATFSLERVAEYKTKFTNHVTFTGLITRFMRDEFFEGGRIGYEEMGLALRKRVEQAFAPSVVEP